MSNRPEKLLGKLPPKPDQRTLQFARFVEFDKLPEAYNPWKHRAPFQPRTFGNTRYGDCTKASQAIACMRFERMETKRTPVISDEEIIRVYREGVRRHYGSDEDLGMYEVDALSDFRNRDTTFRDEAGHEYTIDAFTSINPRSKDEIRAGIALSAKWGIKVCFDLPIAWENVNPEDGPWDVPRDGDGKPVPITGNHTPGTWGGHSLTADRFNKIGLTVPHQWYEGLGLPKKEWPLDEQVITWDAVLAYCSEAYWLLQSLDYWRKVATKAMKSAVDVKGIVKAANKLSSHKVAA